jgi:hypothetical protein
MKKYPRTQGMSAAKIALAPWGVQPNQGFVLSMSKFPRNQGKYNRAAAPWAVKPKKALFYSCQISQGTKVSVAKRYECCGHWNFGFKLRQCKR